MECLWDEVLPIEARELPEDLARLDRVLSDPVLLEPITAAWEQSARERGRPSISMESFVRLMIIKQRTGWGYETLVREVSDSLHLRRFCLIAIDQRVPEESTVRKLARRLGAEVVAEITRIVIEKAQRETRFRARAARIDSTVVEADIRYPSDAMLALQGVRVLAREGKKLTAMIKGKTTRVTDRSRSVGRAVRAISKTLARRTGQAKAEVMKFNERAGRLIARSVREAGRLAVQARAAARGRGAQAKLRTAVRLELLAARCQKVTEQIDRRSRGLKITERLVSLADPDARPIRKGKFGKPTEFGYVAQICEVTENTRKGARGFILPAGHAPGNPAENRLLQQTARELEHGATPCRKPRLRESGRRDDPPRADPPHAAGRREQCKRRGHHGQGDRPRLLRPGHGRAAVIERVRRVSGVSADDHQGEDVRSRDPSGGRVGRTRRPWSCRDLPHRERGWSSVNYRERWGSNDGRWVSALVALTLAMTLAGCAGASSGRSILLYNGQHPQVTSELVAAFEKQTGIKVNVRTNDGIVLADQLPQEGSSSPADVYLTENTPELVTLDQHGLLAKLDSSTLAQVPVQDSASRGHW